MNLEQYYIVEKQVCVDDLSSCWWITIPRNQYGDIQFTTLAWAKSFRTRYLKEQAIPQKLRIMRVIKITGEVE